MYNIGVVSDSDDRRRTGGVVVGHLAGHPGVGKAIESQPLSPVAQGAVAEVLHRGDRSDADSLPRPAGAGHQGDLSQQTQIGNQPLPRLRHGGCGPQRRPLHGGADTCRVRCQHERGRPAVGEAYSPAGHQDPPFAAGQGVLQRQGAFVSEAGGARVHYYRCCCGDARRKTRKPHRPGCGHC